MREYKIYKTSLWYSIYRKKYVGKMVMVQFLNWYELWTPNKTSAKTYYREEDALWALAWIKIKDAKNTD